MYRPEELKAFFNACLHRGTQLKHGCGNAKEIRCPFHAWCWNIDGSIREVTDASDFDPACITADTLHLHECGVGTWGGFVFINMDPHAPPLLDFLNPIPERLARFDLDKMRLSRYRTTIISANWKTALDAFNENYHAIGTHPQSLRYLDNTNWTYECHGMHGFWVGPPGCWGRPDPRLEGYTPDRAETLMAVVEDIGGLDLLGDAEALGQILAPMLAVPDDVPTGTIIANLRRAMALATGVDLSNFTDDEVIYGGTWNVFPNTTLAANGGNAVFLRFRPNGLDPESCLFDVWTLEMPAAGDGEVVDINREFYPDWQSHDGWDRILSQDLTNIPEIQKGMHSRRFEDAITGRQEACVQNFHRTLMSFVDR